jgi:hypothetical protein
MQVETDLGPARRLLEMFSQGEVDLILNEESCGVGELPLFVDWGHRRVAWRKPASGFFAATAFSAAVCCGSDAHGVA